ncbi:amidase signature enzyme [Thozetella sp. PMI_491]|nr:amidase signature enzyme [Thozetella sp. PMI_491]
MGSIPRPDFFINYPEPLKGPEVPYKNDRKTNPPLRGRLIVPAAMAMESLRFIREGVYANAGFTSLRKIRPHIEEYEPWFEPQVVPLALGQPLEDDDVEQKPVIVPSETTDHLAQFPNARYYSAANYRELYLSGELTPTQVAKTLLPLIRRDTTPPGQHSTAWFDTKVEHVLNAAEASTRRYKENRSLGPLDGVPTGVKDEYDMDAYPTTLGSVNEYKGRIPEGNSYNTWCVRKLEAAGAIILGKLSMHEFGLDTTGNNPNYGTPKNPHNQGYYTGGSSSGTGYVVSAGLVPIALGSDGGGSIRIPSAMCGVFGLKPTHGRISLKPGQNHAATCGVLGPIAADIKSLATVYSVIGEPHPTSPFPPIGRLDLAPPSEKLLGIPEAWLARATPAIQDLCRGMIDRLVKEKGYSTVPIDIPFLSEGQTAHALTVLCDGATLLPDTSNLTNANKIMLALGRAAPATDLVLAQKLRRLLMQHLSWLWHEHPGMMIITPTIACAGWPIRSQSELRYGVSDGDMTLKTMEYVWLGNFCGLPSISLPVGFVAPTGHPKAGQIAEIDTEGKIPVGLMATGEWCQEELLLQFGYEVEQIGGDKRARPPVWVDVVAEAKKVRL